MMQVSRIAKACHAVTGGLEPYAPIAICRFVQQNADHS